MALTMEQRAEFEAIRRSMDAMVDMISASAEEINDNLAIIRPWAEGAHAVGEVRMYEDVPYQCVQAHDSTGNPGWTPDATPALWMQYHGTTPETARAWVQPTGAHDQYRAGEYVVFGLARSVGQVYRCMADTTYSPAEYAAAWREIEG